MKVYQAINAVQAELAKVGISKDSENKFDGYKFRGIDAVYNALAPLLAKHGLCVLPRMLTRTCEERQSQKGGALFYVTVDAEFDFVSAEDGSKHTVKTFGEAMDRGDKATNKAMSAAYKYAAFQAFAIPTAGDNDADETSHEVVAKPKPVGSISGPKEAYLSLSADWQAYVLDLSARVENRFEGHGPKAAKETMDEAIERDELQAEHIAATWHKLSSKCRSAIKALNLKEAA